MVKLYCDKDDIYVYGYNENGHYGTEIEVSQETLERWGQISTAYCEMQQEIGTLVRAAEYERTLPKYWWTITVRYETSRLKYGFYGNENQLKSELEKHSTNTVFKKHSTKQEIALYLKESKELNIPIEVD